MPATLGFGTKLPLVGCVPLQLPDAVQLVAVGELQVIVVDLPTATELDASVRVGVAGGAPEVAKTVAVLVADVPAAPVQVNV